MCIFAGPVEQVSGTRIFVGRSGDRQFTAYQMEVTLASLPQDRMAPLDPWASKRDPEPASTAMVLPVPIREETQVSLVDMSKAPDFFDKLNQPFIPQAKSGSRGMSFSLGADDLLEVFDVGDYKVSIAYSVEDINRVDPRVFTLGADAARTLSENYREGFAFIIASLKTSGKISPLGYITTMPNPGTDYPLFIPTRHEHGSKPVWDHFIYVGGRGRFGSSPAVARNPSAKVEITGGTHVGYIIPQIIDLVPALRGFLREGPMTRMRAEGVLNNADLMAGT